MNQGIDQMRRRYEACPAHEALSSIGSRLKALEEDCADFGWAEKDRERQRDLLTLKSEIEEAIAQQC